MDGNALVAASLCADLPLIGGRPAHLAGLEQGDRVSLGEHFESIHIDIHGPIVRRCVMPTLEA